MPGPRDVDDVGLLLLVLGEGREEHLAVVVAMPDEGLLVVEVCDEDAIGCLLL